MTPDKISALLWLTLIGFVVFGVAIGRLLKRLPPSRTTQIVARLLQACCGLGAMLCLAGILLSAFR